MQKISEIPPKNMKHENVNSWLVGIRAHNKGVDVWNSLSENEQNHLLNIERKSHSKFWRGNRPSNHEEMMKFGFDNKWWDKWDDKGPIREWFIDVNKFKFWSQLLCELEFFDSVSNSKKAGWDKPITTGIFKLFKGREIFIVE